jgi:hypothetical protein
MKTMRKKLPNSGLVKTRGATKELKEDENKISLNKAAINN